ncbi:AraC family transcriptional regulator [Ruminococcaceae bacterium OttesenSCG-928-A16]|nr:AraC family transcriptional regulator [Ruminococcaceae bacterium OttesenSCG-928-A16]
MYGKIFLNFTPKRWWIKIELSAQKEVLELARDYTETLLNVPVYMLENQHEAWNSFTTSAIPAFLYSQTKATHFWNSLQLLQENNIYILKDDFAFNFLFLWVQALQRFLVFGPYVDELPTESYCARVVEKQRLSVSYILPLKTYYESLPVAAETQVIAAAQVLLRHLYATAKPAAVKNIYAPEKERHQIIFPASENTDTIRQLEYRYELEEQLMEHVQQGDLAAAQETMLFLRQEISTIVQVGGPLRHQKIISVMFNTLLRKAVQNAGVPAFYCNPVFWDYAYQIEEQTQIEALMQLRFTMLETYVRIVQEHALPQFSLPIRKAIHYIQLHLGIPLHLHNIATAAGLSPSRFSTLFNQEVGLSLTAYINQQRVQRMAHMLQNSQLPIAEISNFVGFSDVSYASRIFRQTKGVSPTQYRQKSDAAP